LIKGSHGRIPEHEEDFPIIMANNGTMPNATITAVDVYDILKNQVFS
jgi:hypothetical protein